MAKIYEKFAELRGKDTDPRSRRYLVPTRIVWTSAEEGADVRGAENLLVPSVEQVTFSESGCCVLKNTPGKPKASVLVDYGRELHGSVRVIVRSVAAAGNRANIRIRLGESAMEAMTDLGVKNTTNDHANRDMVMNVGFLSGMETNESGFRFMRIDLLDDEASVSVKSVNATFIFRDIDYIGSFECSDPLLNKIWDTAAYTAHMNMQEYLWDGIKRDRLIWIGDMHTEVMTILTAFGFNEVVPNSIDTIRDETPITDTQVSWMNGMPAYSLWWLLIQYQWYMGTGNLAYLGEQKDYMEKLLKVLCGLVDENGVEQIPSKFLDWPNHDNPTAEHAGMQGLLCLTLQRGAYLMDVLGNGAMADACRAAAERMKQHVPDDGGSKAAAALLVLSGLRDAKEANENRIAVDGAHGFSTFQGYYLLKAKTMAGDTVGALNALREFWGGMISMGATTFWEDFNLEWMDNAAPITDLVPEGKIDIHGDWGAYCYIKFRHSLCHGWASGPCPYMTNFVLGIMPVEPGCRKVRVKPDLGDLTYAKGTYPTPYGVISVSHEKMPDGSIKTEISAPAEVEIVR